MLEYFGLRSFRLGLDDLETTIGDVEDCSMVSLDAYSHGPVYFELE